LWVLWSFTGLTEQNNYRKACLRREESTQQFCINEIVWKFEIWAWPDLNRRPSLCESDVITARPQALPAPNCIISYYIIAKSQR